jgi:hypothetical protein
MVVISSTLTVGSIAQTPSAEGKPIGHAAVKSHPRRQPRGRPRHTFALGGEAQSWLRGLVAVTASGAASGTVGDSYSRNRLLHDSVGRDSFCRGSRIIGRGKGSSVGAKSDC